MRIIILIVLVISGLTAVACSSEAPSTVDEQTASRPTADVPATVEAGIRSTREAETAIDATVEAKVAAALTNATATPYPTPTPEPTLTPRPTPTPRPTSGVASQPVPVTRWPEVVNNGSSRLAVVRNRGILICASRNDVPGFGFLDASGINVGFDIDLCRAVATAVLADPNAIEIRLITAAERGPTIQSGEVDPAGAHGCLDRVARGPVG